MLTELPRKTDTAYLQILDSIKTGVWKIGNRIPSEMELAATFKCSRGTISKALTRLSHEGLVERKTKTGTTILRNAADRPSRSVNFDSVAFIYPSNKHEGIWRTATGFQGAALENGKRSMMLTTGIDYKKEAELIGSLNEFNVRGAVIYLMIETPQDQIYISQAVAQSKFPIVLACINLPGMNIPGVIFDDFHGGYTMTKYLIGKGARRIGFFASSRAPDGCNGYHWALQEAGIKKMPELVVMEQHMHANFKDPLREPAKLAREYLVARPDLDGVVCGHDFLAIGLIEAAHKLGIKVPQDLLITGIDDFVIPSPVPLTTYRVPYEEIGKTAFNLLMESIQTGRTAVMEHRLTGQLVVRKSA